MILDAIIATLGSWFGIILLILTTILYVISNKWIFLILMLIITIAWAGFFTYLAMGINTVAGSVGQTILDLFNKIFNN